MSKYNPEAKKLYYQKNKQRISEYWKSFYQENKDKLKAKQKKQYREKLAAYLFYAAKARSEKLGIPFNLEKSDIAIPEVCPVLGIPLEQGDKNKAPSVDRIRPELGYVKGNVAVISFRANKIKSNATADELQKVADWVRSSTGEELAKRLQNTVEIDFQNKIDSCFTEAVK